MWFKETLKHPQYQMKQQCITLFCVSFSHIKNGSGAFSCLNNTSMHIRTYFKKVIRGILVQVGVQVGVDFLQQVAQA